MNIIRNAYLGERLGEISSFEHEAATSAPIVEFSSIKSKASRSMSNYRRRIVTRKVAHTLGIKSDSMGELQSTTLGVGCQVYYFTFISTSYPCFPERANTEKRK
jgi:hypothetical protein